MAIDPSIVTGIKQPVPFQERQLKQEAADVQLNDARAQTASREAEAMKAQIQNKDAQARQFAGKAVQDMVQRKMQEGKFPTTGDFWLAAGPYGDEFAKMYHDNVSKELTNKKLQLDNAAKVSDYAGTLTRGMLATDDLAQRQKILADGVQNGLQIGLLEPDVANELLSHGTTDSELQGYLAQDEPAFKAQLEQGHKQFDDMQKMLDQSLKFQAEQRAVSAQKETSERAAAALEETKRHNLETESKVPTIQERKEIAAAGKSVNTGIGATSSDPKDIAKAIMAGDQPPVLTGLYRDASPVRAELARAGYDLSTATSDWNATQKLLSSLNSTQQSKLRQAITFTNETLPQIEDAYAEWKKQAGTSGFKVLNKAALATMKQLPGKPGSAATNLEALIADFTSELGTVYKGGNSSTDESLKLAAKNLSGDWNDQTFKDAVTRLKKSLVIRNNSMKAIQPAGASNRYMPDAGGGTGQATHRFNPATGKIEAK